MSAADDPMPRRPSGSQIIRALKDLQHVALVAGSAWDIMPGSMRRRLLEQAFEAEKVLIVLAASKKGTLRRRRKAVALRHPEMDLEALGSARCSLYDMNSTPSRLALPSRIACPLSNQEDRP